MFYDLLPVLGAFISGLLELPLLSVLYVSEGLDVSELSEEFNLIGGFPEEHVDQPLDVHLVLFYEGVLIHAVLDQPLDLPLLDLHQRVLQQVHLILIVEDHFGSFFIELALVGGIDHFLEHFGLEAELDFVSDELAGVLGEELLAVGGLGGEGVQLREVAQRLIALSEHLFVPAHAFQDELLDVLLVLVRRPHTPLQLVQGDVLLLDDVLERLVALYRNKALPELHRQRLRVRVHLEVALLEKHIYLGSGFLRFVVLEALLVFLSESLGGGFPRQLQQVLDRGLEELVIFLGLAHVIIQFRQLYDEVFGFLVNVLGEHAAVDFQANIPHGLDHPHDPFPADVVPPTQNRCEVLSLDVLQEIQLRLHQPHLFLQIEDLFLVLILQLDHPSLQPQSLLLALLQPFFLLIDLDEVIEVELVFCGHFLLHGAFVLLDLLQIVHFISFDLFFVFGDLDVELVVVVEDGAALAFDLIKLLLQTLRLDRDLLLNPLPLIYVFGVEDFYEALGLAADPVVVLLDGLLLLAPQVWLQLRQQLLRHIFLG